MCSYLPKKQIHTPAVKFQFYFIIQTLLLIEDLNENLLHIDWAEYQLTPEYRNIQWNIF